MLYTRRTSYISSASIQNTPFNQVGMHNTLQVQCRSHHITSSRARMRNSGSKGSFSETEVTLVWTEMNLQTISRRSRATSQSELSRVKSFNQWTVSLHTRTVSLARCEHLVVPLCHSPLQSKDIQLFNLAHRHPHFSTFQGLTFGFSSFASWFGVFWTGYP